MFRLDRVPGRSSLCALVVTGAMIAAACGSDSSGGATAEVPDAAPVEASDEPNEVVSDDGRLRFVAPSAELGLSATALDPDEVAPETEEIVSAYQLEPSGVTFDAPLEMELRIPNQAGQGQMAVGTILSTDDGAEAEMLPTSVEADGDELVVRFEVTHFSRVWVWAHGLTYSLPEPHLEGFVDDDFDPELLITAEFEGEQYPIEEFDGGLRSSEYTSTETEFAIEFGTALGYPEDVLPDVVFFCVEPGEAIWSVRIDVDPWRFIEEEGAEFFRTLSKDRNPARWDHRLPGTATCKERPGDAATTQPPSTSEPPPVAESAPEAADDEDPAVAVGVPNGVVASNCTATSATDYRCDLDPLPSASELDSDCPYGLDYPSSVPDSVRYSSFGLWQAADGNIFMNTCSSSAAWDPTAEAGFDPGWTVSAGIGNDDSASASTATLSYSDPTVDGLLVDFDRELAELFASLLPGPEGLISGNARSSPPRQSTTVTLIWFVGLNSAEPISGTAAFNYTGPDGQNETVIFPFEPENVTQYPGGLRDRYPDARNVAG